MQFIVKTFELDSFPELSRDENENPFNALIRMWNEIRWKCFNAFNSIFVISLMEEQFLHTEIVRRREKERERRRRRVQLMVRKNGT